MAFIDEIKARAKADKKTIVLPETEDVRTYQAAEAVLREGTADLMVLRANISNILENREIIRKKLQQASVNIESKTEEGKQETVALVRRNYVCSNTGICFSVLYK